VVLQEFVEHYNTHRPHRPFDQHPPDGRTPPPSGANIRPLRRDRLGGLVHEYLHVAWHDRVLGTDTAGRTPRASACGCHELRAGAAPAGRRRLEQGREGLTPLPSGLLSGSPRPVPGDTDVADSTWCLTAGVIGFAL
jgi:hypothetical protein